MSSYQINFKCSNCGKIFPRTLSKGVRAQGNGGECINCGCKDEAPFWFHVVDENEHQKLLMEMKEWPTRSREF